ncbi:MAG: hypothetical protein JJV99_01530 [Colwellia sp.]|nr:hypothetical protein [Colwellia sp.]
MKQFASAISTPLASIFGSGFLVIVPILAGAVGSFSVFAMMGVCFLAFMVGEVIRFNIIHVEPVLKNNTKKSTLLLDKTSDFALILAYVISVCLYLHILSAFVLTGLDLDTDFNKDALTTTIIVIITLIGLFKGLEPLEVLEKWALIITLIIIALLSITFAHFDFNLWKQAVYIAPKTLNYTNWQVLTVLAGTLIVVQGFETSRYLGHTYSAELRVQTSRWSQYISTCIYIIFVALTLPTVYLLNGQYNDHSLIDLVTSVSLLFVTPLILAATLSQFSAAVADMLAAVGNISELTKDKLTEKQGYLIVGCGAIILTWTVDTFEVLALASRSFAFYYLLQCLVALSISKSLGYRVFFIVTSIVLGFITLFAVPAG